ncbi:Protein CBG20985 [Caenorhabditis briggsae]|uniref:Serpentine receptor class gamma n=1 Tax=Caenorhabditis briggsae TaxID=6238 RepID=A8XZ38_CAEBR|nr:Protein CBG20985 [Caenorhabditis briggsae]CAP37905.1 Protein CBG20985 [Caenorhabditis briggsae]
MSNSSADLAQDQCDLDYDSIWEAIIYFGTFTFLGSGLYLHLTIIKTILVTERKYFCRNSFFKITVMDSLASVVVILNELFFNRLFIYSVPFCPTALSFFSSPSVILNFVFISLNHARLSKSVSQIFMVLNRMTSVLFPTDYEKIWRVMTPISCV